VQELESKRKEHWPHTYDPLSDKHFPSGASNESNIMKIEGKYYIMEKWEEVLCAVPATEQLTNNQSSSMGWL
jgi:hypothetical protein